MTTNQEERSWESELREYIDKNFKQKKAGMNGLDREIIIDFVRKTEDEAYKRGKEYGRWGERERVAKQLNINIPEGYLKRGYEGTLPDDTTNLTGKKNPPRKRRAKEQGREGISV